MDARTAALRALGDLREGRQTARHAIEAVVGRYGLADRDRSLAMELVTGVVRHRLTLSTVLAHFTNHRWKHVSRRLQQTLMLGAYQLIWLDSVPAFAAVNEAVNQAKAEGGRGAGQFVNAVLRQLERRIEHRRVPVSQADPVRAILVDRTTCCQLADPVFADPLRQPIDHLSQTTSHPAWLVSRWMDAFGSERTGAICRAGMLRPPIFLRPNRLRTDAATMVEQLAEAGFQPQLAAGGEAILVQQTAALPGSPLLRAGLFQPQDPTATRPVRRMELQPGQTVLDLCAGLGTKTTQMVEAMGDDGRILATDIDAARLDGLAEVVQRLGYRSVDVVPMHELEDRVRALGRLDWILVDAPCSNSGVLARRPEIRYRLSMRGLIKIAEVQLGLLDQAARLAGPQTRIMYSTCSIDPEENQQVCVRFLEAHPDWMLADSYLTLPDAGDTAIDWHDGGYWAVLARK
ncbi:MAG TPA: transcription antitermination factor NusB [Phycisphaerae bacterium]|nr:transcription antitermination factor NusB [Phycisphaerae bacterium]HOJ74547.1 transcription antitermination factor NusB [Phycisphaerae bacterium]HOM52748.1 transcription antitermination factor NusB [Phycisphaerae bacterium]HON67020.1 transcription antitermination factor NusB [Phycisphaerae bacterium]HOQ87731.1 transcription antitermination factor NusB [Phycisphaerae bacterium]